MASMYHNHWTTGVDDLFAKMKEQLRETRYNTRDERIHGAGLSLRNINKDGRADAVRRLPNIWPCEKYGTVAITFYPALVAV